jgi:hypothetical protein
MALKIETDDAASQYELLKIILDFIGTIIWPVTVCFIILMYKEAILRLINRARKVELPGGVSLETVEDDIKQAKELSQETEAERKPEVKALINKEIEFGGKKRLENETNKKMIQLGLTPSPSGLNLDYYKSISVIDPRLALIGLRSDFELMLRNLAKGFKIPIKEKETATRIVSMLFEKGAISGRQFEFINSIFKILNSAAHGALITKEQVYEVLDIGQVLVDDYIAWLDWGFKK